MSEASTAGRIVIGVDGSEASTVALRWAAAEAARRGMGLDVVHAWTTPYPLSAPEVFQDPSPYEANGRAVIDRAVAAATSSGDVPSGMRPVLVQDHPGKALVDAARGAELLVVSSRGRGGFKGLLLGSVSQHCLHHATCPVAVIPPGWGGDDGGKVVVGVDGSASSVEALRWAVASAAGRGAALDVVNAFDPGIEWMAGVEIATVAAASTALLNEAIDTVLDASDAQPAAIERVAVPASSPAAALLDQAASAALLVVGTRGRGPMRERLLGSVSHQCVSHAPCPVVVVRHG